MAVDPDLRKRFHHILYSPLFFFQTLDLSPVHLQNFDVRVFGQQGAEEFSVI